MGNHAQTHIQHQVATELALLLLLSTVAWLLKCITPSGPLRRGTAFSLNVRRIRALHDGQITPAYLEGRASSGSLQSKWMHGSCLDCPWFDHPPRPSTNQLADANLDQARHELGVQT